MRVLFVWPHYIGGEVPLGLLYLSSLLKQHGHQTCLFYFNPYFGRKPKYLEAAINDWFLEKLEHFAPDLVGFSVISTAFDLSLRLAALAKEQSKLVIFGGAHPTVDPEGTIHQEPVDMICVGEGEHALLDLVTALEQNGDITPIQNIWSKNGTEIYRNPPRPLLRDLDSLPYPDRDLLDPMYLNPRDRGGSFITGRGCPYTCSYCINERLQEIYRGNGPFVRYRAVDSVIQEIKLFVERHAPRELFFSDEVFSLNEKRLIAFCEAYGREIGLPFRCQTRADAVDQEVARALKNAGCSLASIGIEAGNDHIRKAILNRKMDKETIIRACHLLKEAGIRVGTFNMIGVPTETEETIWETIDLNREVGADYVHCTILMPFRGTKIRDEYERGNLLRKEPSASYYLEVTQDLPTISPTRLVAYQRLFDLYVYADARHCFIISMLMFLWSRVPLTITRWSPYRLLRSLAYRLTRLARKMLISSHKRAAYTS